MRAFCGHVLGDLGAFGLEKVDAPSPGPGELLVSVEATALGFVDQLVMRGLYQIKPPTPFVPGGEIVGTVEAVGSDVRNFAPGDRIATWQFGGGLAEKALVQTDRAVPVPANLEVISTAALLLDYLTAYYGLFDRGGLKPGQSLLVTGASGGVGYAAVQLANATAVTVIGLASSDAKREIVSLAGASQVIDYRNEDWRKELKQIHPAGVDMVFDPVGGGLFEPCFRSLAKQGRHLVVGFASEDGIPSLPANLPLLKSAELVGVDARHLWDIDPARVCRILSIVLQLAATKRIAPLVGKTFALDEAASAIAYLTDEDRIGKVVVRI